MKTKKNLPEKYNHKIDIEQAFKMRYAQGLTLEQIGKFFDCSASAVQQRLDKFIKVLPEPEDVEIFKENMSNLIQSGMFKVFMKAIQDGSIDNSKLWEKTNFIKEMFNTYRLIEDKSTANIAYKDMSKDIERLEKAIQDYKDKQLNEKLNTE